MDSWGDNSLITKSNSVVAWEYESIDGVFQWEYVSYHIFDHYEEILMGRFIHGPHFQPTHKAL